ncbi:hypothetical protein XO10_04210 [Marinitoga sp. 1135]|uniref:hypothetical protein n=1 Tax=unclassified Marinitoga TaxID=2640159 RepID=UPI001586A93D|nr:MULTISPECIES: hypothetical protein [unclassified Marinitoga]NUU95493.1 hypothetical protein [Marinitoga sp. 1135]NUU97420.1 hypothetical protein [Marinitoga sp. 1138]
MKKTYSILIMIILVMLSGCSLFDFNKEKAQQDKIAKIIEKEQKLNIIIEKNKYIAFKEKQIPINLEIKDLKNLNPENYVDKIEINSDSTNATATLEGSLLHLKNFTKAGTYTLTFYHSDISTDLNIEILPATPINLKVELDKKIFIANKKVEIPLKIYFIDKYGNSIVKKIKEIKLYPVVKYDIEHISEGSYMLNLYNLTRPGKYIFSMFINGNKKDIEFSVIPDIIKQISFDNSIVKVATYSENKKDFIIQKIKYKLYDRYGNLIPGIKNLGYKIISDNIYTPKIKINYDENYIEVIGGVYPGIYKVEFYNGNYKLNGELKIEVKPFPRKIIILNKKIGKNFSVEFSVYDGNSNFAQNIKIEKIKVFYSNTIKEKEFSSSELKKHLRLKGNIYTFNTILDDYPTKIELYIKSKDFNTINIFTISLK